MLTEEEVKPWRNILTLSEKEVSYKEFARSAVLAGDAVM
jgi:hypothetical protein